MIEVKNLKKTYNVKGNITNALDDVSIKFPEKGMVFLLGKSGSGKSTLLNVIGGLDKIDSGEIIIKGRSSASFSNSDFDSYRNTFVGFIFQEYNVLNEFTIEDNLALALELQGKKKDKAKVQELLKQVDLEGFAKRKPNTLSGGQKQRIAIARALIKNPEIIMADEPTGALDSNTGKQVFDTLKKLSEEKLIIVVSHDRDFAEIYGDRIIELADGKIISDMTKFHVEPKEIDGNINVINDNVLSIKNVNELKRDDLDKIYDLLKSKNGEVIIASNEKNIDTFKQAAHINSDNKSEVFDDTKEIKTKDYNPKDTKFIKSHLPFKKAFKMGASSLKSKPIRMIFTIILTVAALVMFGVASTLMLYDQSYSVKEALKNSDNDYEQINKLYKYETIYHSYDLINDKDDVQSKYENYDKALFSTSDINSLNSKSDSKYVGVIKFGKSKWDSSYVVQFNTTSGSNKYYHFNGLYGLVDAGEEFLNSNGFRILEGTYPTKPNEIAISNYTYETLKTNDNTINDYNSLIGKKINSSISTSNYSFNEEFTVTAIIDCGTVPSQFDEIKNEQPNLNPKDLQTLTTRYENYIKLSFHTLGYVSNDFYQYYKEKYNISYSSNQYINSLYATGMVLSRYGVDGYDNVQDFGFSFYNSKIIDKLNLQFKDLNGNSISFTSPKEDEVYISSGIYNQMLQEYENNKYSKLYLMFDQNFLMEEISDLTTTELDNLRSLVNNYNKTTEDKATLQQYLDLFPKFIRIYNAYNNQYNYLSQYQLAHPDYNTDTNYQEINELFNNFNQEINNNTYNYDDYLEQIEEIFNDGLLTKWNIWRLIRDLYDSSVYQKGKTIVYKDQLDEYINRDIDKNPLTDADYDTLIQILVANDITDYEYDNSKSTSYSEKELENIIYYKSATGNSGKLKIIGLLDTGDFHSESYVLNDNFINSNATLRDEYYYYNEYSSSYQNDENAYYDSLITKTNYTENDIKLMLSDFGSYKYEMTNSTYSEISLFINMINNLKKIFLYIGLVVAVFAALMLFNFISSSISSKTKEIGILRAVGARGSDLFKIFFCESGVIALICVILSIIISIITCNALNTNLAENINLTLLKFSPINMGLIFAGALLIAIIGTFIPVLLASKKQPVESIRQL